MHKIINKFGYIAWYTPKLLYHTVFINKQMENFDQHLKTYNLEKVSNTKWKARLNSVKAARYTYANIYDALLTQTYLLSS